MKFLVSDTAEERHAQIRGYLTDDTAVIAVCLATIDLEWTIRRVLDAAMPKDASPESGGHISGLGKYEEEWKKVAERRERAVGARPMPALPTVVGEWEELKVAFKIRHEIVHGRAASTSLKYAAPRVERILAASRAVCAAGVLIGADPYRRLRRRRLAGPEKPRAKTS